MAEEPIFDVLEDLNRQVSFMARQQRDLRTSDGFIPARAVLPYGQPLHAQNLCSNDGTSRRDSRVSLNRGEDYNRRNHDYDHDGPMRSSRYSFQASSLQPEDRVSAHPASNSVPHLTQFRQLSPNALLDNASSQQLQQPQQTSTTHFNHVQETLATNRNPAAHDIQLISTMAVADRFRSIFKSYPHFNLVQSKCFCLVYQSDSNFVLSAPTGSGKTVVFELAICRLASTTALGEYKIVYQAPTKALCAERFKDWQKKFDPLGLKCAEVTGDTEQKHLSEIRESSIIITTPEKWDSLTRRWRDHAKLMRLVKLFLIDEVHTLKDERGATLEAVVSRMKSIGGSVRFVAVSATVPNSDDIATWLGRTSDTPEVPAHHQSFGDEYRPVVLQKHVCGYPALSNYFAFEASLDSKLPVIIKKYSQRKPILIFCSTRRHTVSAAKALAEWWRSSDRDHRFWNAPSRPIPSTDNDLMQCTPAGVAYHHAGLSQADRLLIEEGFLRGDIQVICCTSTLAVGVNLPCHFVIIKGTMGYEDKAFKERSELEVLQMLGRAGRPQFENSAVAVILTEQENVSRWQRLVNGNQVIESSLHLNLVEHLNSEIVLGTITSVETAMSFLRSTFLYIRLQRNPEHYDLGEESGELGIEDILERICNHQIRRLQDRNMVTDGRSFRPTPYGQTMAKYYIKFDTACRLIDTPQKAKMSEILSELCQADEFKDLKFRQGEKTIYQEINGHNQMRFPIHEPLALPAHKVSILVQSTLGSIDFPETDKGEHLNNYTKEKTFVFLSLERLVRCIADIFIDKSDSTSLRNTLALGRSINAECWDDSPLQMKQIEGIGIASVRKLAMMGIRSVEDLELAEPSRIEGILKRAPPFGRKLLDKVKQFPQPHVTLRVIGRPQFKSGQGATLKFKADVGFMNESPTLLLNHKPVYVILLAETSDGQLLLFARITAKQIGKGKDTMFEAHLTSASQVVFCHVMCDGIAGTLRTAQVKPTVPSIAWPSQISRIETVTNHNTNRRVIKSRPASRKSDDYDLEDDDEEALLFAASQAENNVNSAYEVPENVLGASSKNGPLYEHGQAQSSKKSLSSTQPGRLTEAKPLGDEWAPARLPNGRYKCNHACKDKTKCKHLCCREGVDKPKPPKPKAKSIDSVGIATRGTPIPRKQTIMHSFAAKSAPKSQLRPEARHPSGFDGVEELDLTEYNEHVATFQSKNREEQVFHVLQESSANVQRSPRAAPKPRPMDKFVTFKPSSFTTESNWEVRHDQLVSDPLSVSSKHRSEEQWRSDSYLDTDHTSADPKLVDSGMEKNDNLSDYGWDENSLYEAPTPKKPLKRKFFELEAPLKDVSCGIFVKRSPEVHSAKGRKTAMDPELVPTRRDGIEDNGIRESVPNKQIGAHGTELDVKGRGPDGLTYDERVKAWALQEFGDMFEFV